MNFQNVVVSVAFYVLAIESHYTSLYLISKNWSYLFASGLRAVKITTKFWELKKPHPRRISKRRTESWRSNFTQTKTTHLVPQKHLKVKKQWCLTPSQGRVHFKRFNLYMIGFECFFPPLIVFQLLAMPTLFWVMQKNEDTMTNMERRDHNQAGKDIIRNLKQTSHQRISSTCSLVEAFQQVNNYNQ